MDYLYKILWAFGPWNENGNGNEYEKNNSL